MCNNLPSKKFLWKTLTNVNCFSYIYYNIYTHTFSVHSAGQRRVPLLAYTYTYMRFRGEEERNNGGVSSDDVSGSRKGGGNTHTHTHTHIPAKVPGIAQLNVHRRYHHFSYYHYRHQCWHHHYSSPPLPWIAWHHSSIPKNQSHYNGIL